MILFIVAVIVGSLLIYFILRHRAMPTDNPLEKEMKLSGYIGNPEKWHDALVCWGDLIGCSFSETIQSQSNLTKTDAYKRLLALHPNLPQSYLDFLQANGTEMKTRHHLDHPNAQSAPYFFKPDEIELYQSKFPKQYETLADNIELFELYGLEKMLVIGYEADNEHELDDGGFYLLNPEQKSTDGEWELIYIHFSYPLDNHYPSFAHFMAGFYMNDLDALTKNRRDSYFIADYQNDPKRDWEECCFAQLLDPNCLD